MLGTGLGLADFLEHFGQFLAAFDQAGLVDAGSVVAAEGAVHLQELREQRAAEWSFAPLGIVGQIADRDPLPTFVPREHIRATALEQMRWTGVRALPCAANSSGASGRSVIS